MPTAKLDLDKVKSFLTKHLKSFKDASTIKLRRVQKAVAKQFGQGLFMPKLSALVKSIRPDYVAKPTTARKTAAKRRGPGRPAASVNGAAYIVQLGRKSQTVRSHARLQAVVDQLLAGGASVGKLKVFRLVPVTVATRVEVGE